MKFYDYDYVSCANDWLSVSVCVYVRMCVCVCVFYDYIFNSSCIPFNASRISSICVTHSGCRYSFVPTISISETNSNQHIFLLMNGMSNGTIEKNKNKIVASLCNIITAQIYKLCNQCLYCKVFMWSKKRFLNKVEVNWDLIWERNSE